MSRQQMYELIALRGHPSCARHKSYHLTCEQYEALLAPGTCAVCGRSPKRIRSFVEKFHIEHDHALGRRAVRGFVCPGCNTRIGRIEADQRVPDEAMLRYLEHPWYRVAGITDFGCPADCARGSHRRESRPRGRSGSPSARPR